MIDKDLFSQHLIKNKITDKIINIQDILNDLLLGDHYRVFLRKQFKVRSIMIIDTLDNIDIYKRLSKDVYEGFKSFRNLYFQRFNIKYNKKVIQ